MSRYANMPLSISDGVDIMITDSEVKAKGGKGELTFKLPKGVKITQEDKVIRVNQVNDKDTKAKSFVGLSYRMIGNLVEGVSKGFQKTLTFTGVGYRMSVKGNILNMQLGFSHDINFEIPAGIDVKVDKQKVVIAGIDKELVGRVADKIKSYRPIEPYKGKGLKYENQYVIRKAGKSGGK